MAQPSTALHPGFIRRFVPKRPLRRFIDLFWQYDGLDQGHSLERVLPTGRMQMIINLAEDETRIYNSEDPAECLRLDGVILCGPYSEPFVIDTEQQASIIGVSFTPAVRFRFSACRRGQRRPRFPR